MTNAELYFGFNVDDGYLTVGRNSTKLSAHEAVDLSAKLLKYATKHYAEEVHQEPPLRLAETQSPKS